MLLLLISLGFSVLLCWHAIKTRQEQFWLWIILMFQGVGGVVYLCVVLIPSLFRTPTARKLGEGAREALDPTRDYREAKKGVEDSPTVHNRMRLAAAASELGRHEEAEALYREAAQGVHAEDPALRLGLAKSLLDLNRPREALTQLQAIEPDEVTAAVTLAFGRAYEGVQRPEEAESAYRAAMDRMPGLEPIARYAAFLGAIGRRTEAEAQIRDIEARTARTSGPFRKEAQAWLAFAKGQ